MLDKLSQRLDMKQLCAVFEEPPATIKPALGSLICFQHGGKLLTGKVIRRNRHTLTVEVGTSNQLSHWRVPYHLAERQGPV